MAYRFLPTTIEQADPACAGLHVARPEVYTASVLSPDTCSDLARAVIDRHAHGASWESPTRYAPSGAKHWDINRSFRSSRNLSPELPGLHQAYAALDTQALQAFPLLGLDRGRSTVRRISDQCILYRAGDHLGEHADDSDSYEDDRGHTIWRVIKPQRHLVGVMWLTTQTADGAGEFEFAGGELRFNSLIDDRSGEPLAIRPAAGKLVVFPASAWFRHEVLPVRAGHRITVTRWWEVVPCETPLGVC